MNAKPLAVLLLVLGSALAQDDLPSAPQASTAKPESQIGAICQSTGANCEPRFLVRPKQSHEVWDNQTKLLEAFKWAAIVADIETTAHGLKSGRCKESNPLAGKSPSRVKMYGTLVPIAAFHTIMGWQYQKRHPKSKFWKITTIIMGGTHGFVAIANSRCL
jgi:hypothetical protein